VRVARTTGSWVPGQQTTAGGAPLVAPKYLRRRETWGLLLTTVLTMTGVFAAVNGVAPSLAQNVEAGFGMRATMASLLLLTPYALIGWGVGPFAGRLAPKVGYANLLRLRSEEHTSALQSRFDLV